MNQIKNVAFIGTGSMGRPMITKLLDAGYHVQVYDKYKKTADSIVAKGAVWKSSPKEAVRGCKVVVTCLPLPSHVRENMVGQDGCLAGMDPSSVWIDCSTTDYHNTLNIAKEGELLDVASLEAPVSNLSHMGVDFANVAFYVGGNQSAYEKCRAVIDTMGEVSFYAGQIGNGQTVKLFTNMLFYVATVVWSEMLVLSKHVGIPLLPMWDYVKTSRADSFVTNQCTPLLLDGSYDYSCTLEITVKDMGLTVELADELKVPLPLGRIINSRYKLAGDRYDSQDNHLIVGKLVEEENGINLKVPDFIGPSPYGTNRKFRHLPGRLKDKFGRIKPELPKKYLNFGKFTSDQKEKADRIIEFVALTNYYALQEGMALGVAKGFKKEFLDEVIRFSVAPSWVHDNIDSYSASLDVCEKLESMISSLTLPATRQILEWIPRTAICS